MDIISGIRTIISADVSADIKNPLIEMALGAKRIETHIVKFSTHPTEVKQKFSKYHKTANITKQYSQEVYKKRQQQSTKVHKCHLQGHQTNNIHHLLLNGT